MIPIPPKTGKHILTSNNGNIQWEPSPSEETSNNLKYLYIIAGQSNTGTNTGPILNGIDDPHPKIFQLSRGLQNKNYNPNTKGSWINAQHPLQHPMIPYPNTVGFGLSFAKTKIKSLPKNSEIYLICCGTGGTAFLPTDLGYGPFSWRKEFNGVNNLYKNMITDIKNALISIPNLQIGGLLWHQGESDLDNWQYAQDISNFINNYRKDLGDYNIPFICGTMLKSWKDMDSRSKHIDNTHKTIQQNQWLSRCVIFDDLLGAHDLVHYNADSQRIMGYRYAISSNDVDTEKEQKMKEYTNSKMIN